MTEPAVMACPDCGKPVEVLQACGATSYFCNHCNELKSSQRIRVANPALFEEKR